MKSLTSLTNLFTTLSQNTTAANTSLGQQLISDQHRYLLQKYFDNERTYTTVSVGAQTLTLTGSLALGATTGTLNAVWPSITCQQLVVFSNTNQRTVTFTQGSAAISWQSGLTATATTSISALGVQAYPIAANVSKIKNATITVGQLVYTPSTVQSIQEWTQLNALPYTSDIPNQFYIYNNQLMFWPIPSSSGNIISFNYKAKVPELTFADYSTGTITSGAIGSNAIVGSSTSWNTTGAFPLNVDLTYANLFIAITPPKGDGLWYPIQRFTSDTALTLNLPIANASSISGASYVIGQFPLLQEDFHDMLVYGALLPYFSSIVPNPQKYGQFKAMYDERLNLMENYLGTKSIQVDLGSQVVPNNPNLFTFYPPH